MPITWENFSCPIQQEKLGVRQTSLYLLIYFARAVAEISALACFGYLLFDAPHFLQIPGACTSALLQVLYRDGHQAGDMSWVQVLRQMRGVLNGMGFDVSHLFCTLLFVVVFQHIVLIVLTFLSIAVSFVFGLLANPTTYQVRYIDGSFSLDWYLVHRIW